MRHQHTILNPRLLLAVLMLTILGGLASLMYAPGAAAGEPVDTETGERSAESGGPIRETTLYGHLKSRPLAHRQPSPSEAPGATPDAPVKILMYHYIRDTAPGEGPTGRNLSVSPQDFEAQMRLLVSKGYMTLSLDEVVEAWQTGQPLPPQSVVLTFDDGYEDFFTAARPILRALDLKATVYIITGRVGQPGYMTWEQIQQLADEGFTIGSHTVTHLSLPTLSAANLATELTRSRQTLEETLGRPVVHFAYPSGAFDARVRAAAAQAGYATATTTRYGACLPGADPLALPRLRVSGGASLAYFAGLLNSATRR